MHCFFAADSGYPEVEYSTCKSIHTIMFEIFDMRSWVATHLRDYRSIALPSARMRV